MHYKYRDKEQKLFQLAMGLNVPPHFQIQIEIQNLNSSHLMYYS